MKTARSNDIVWRVVAAMALSSMLASSRPAVADHGDCLQPTSTSSRPTAADVLSILRHALGKESDCDARPCICDCSLDGKVTVFDALCTMRRVLNPPEDAAICECAETSPAGADGSEWSSDLDDE